MRRLATFLAVLVFVALALTVGNAVLNPQRTPEVTIVHADKPAVPTQSTDFPRSLTIPVQGVSAKDIQDTFDQARGSEHRHEATDILAPRGTPVLAVDDGVIQKLFLSKPGGITLYQFDPTGEYGYYYAHLERYADDIREGLSVMRGDVIGFVGTTGNAPDNTPHLHFGIFKLGPEKRWWQGTPINPYSILIRLAQ